MTTKTTNKERKKMQNERKRKARQRREERWQAGHVKTRCASKGASSLILQNPSGSLTWFINVGSLCHPRLQVPSDGPHYNFDVYGHLLTVFVHRPTRKEIAGFNSAWECSLLEDPDALFLCFRNAGFPWQDAPYSFHVVPESRRAVPDESSTDAAALAAVLVDTETGIVKSLATVTLPPRLSSALHGAIRRQSKRSPDPAAHARAISAVYSMYPMSEGLARAGKRLMSEHGDARHKDSHGDLAAPPECEMDRRRGASGPGAIPRRTVPGGELFQVKSLTELANELVHIATKMEWDIRVFGGEVIPGLEPLQMVITVGPGWCISSSSSHPTFRRVDIEGASTAHWMLTKGGLVVPSTVAVFATGLDQDDLEHLMERADALLEQAIAKTNPSLSTDEDDVTN